MYKLRPVKQQSNESVSENVEVKQPKGSLKQYDTNPLGLLAQKKESSNISRDKSKPKSIEKSKSNNEIGKDENPSVALSLATTVENVSQAYLISKSEMQLLLRQMNSTE